MGSKLTSIKLPASVKELPQGVFKECRKLKSVKLASGTRNIGAYAFSSCSSLKKISLNKKLESIGKNAFENSGLVSLKIPSKVKKIGQSVIAGNSKLKSIKVDPKNKYYDSRDESNAIIRTKSSKLIAACNYTVLPDTILVIGSNSYSGLNKITEIAFPKHLKEIEEYAFSGCDKLRKLRIPLSVKAIGKFAFYDSGLKEIDYQGRFVNWNGIKRGNNMFSSLVQIHYGKYR
jgi:hypothetical protein